MSRYFSRSKRIGSSLVLKLILPIIVIGLLIIAGFFGFYSYLSQRIVDQQTLSEAKSISQTLVISIQADAEKISARRVLSALAADKNIEHLSLVEIATAEIVADSSQANYDSVIYEAFEEEELAIYHELSLRRSGEAWLVQTPLFYQLTKVELIHPELNRGRPYALFLIYDQTEALHSVAKDILKVLIPFCIGIGLILISVYLVQRRVLITPLKSINQTIRSHRSGDMPESISHQSDDELGQLIDSYNTLISNLSSHSQDLEVAKEKAEEAARIKSEFLASMSHEIRTPMNGILGMLKLLMKTELNSEQTHKTRLIQFSAQSLLSLINDILDFSKIEAGKLDLELMQFDMIDFLGEIAEVSAHTAQDKGVEFVLDTSEVDYPVITGDPGRIRQILTNLIGNAIKFTAEGSVIVRSRNSIENDCLTLVIEVEDSGIGIAQDKIDNLFESFTQADASTTRKYGGTGLGLTIARRLCEMMRGNIEVKSELGRGSCFRIQLLLDLPETSVLDYPQKSCWVLIVDHHVESADILKKQLERFSCQVEIARSAEHAYDILNDHFASDQHYENQVVFVDWNFDDGRGGEFIQQMREKFSQHPWDCVLMSPFSVSNKDIDFAALRLTANLCKPITLANIEQTFKNIDQQIVIDSHSRSNQSSQVIQERRWPDGTRVLLAEDNFINQEVAVGILEDFGLMVDIANNGVEVIDRLIASSRTTYSLIIMDCQMPEMDGFEASRQVREGVAGSIHRELPIIAMTANAMKGDKERCLDVGMNDYLSKPIDTDMLLDMLQKWIQPIATQERDTIQSENNKEPQLDQVWDEASALKRVRNKPERLVKIMSSFMDNLPNDYAQLEQAIKERDYDTIKYVAHTIKGSAANMSAIDLSLTASEIEEASVSQNEAKLDALAEKIKNQVTQLENYLEDFFAKAQTKIAGKD